MRSIVYLSIVVFVLGCAGAKHGGKKNADLDGTWVPVRQEIGGVALPNAVLDQQRLTISDTTYTMVAESTDKGSVHTMGNKMDIYGRDGVNAGKHFTAIYKYEDGQLTICYNLAGDAYPESYETKGKSTWFLSVFKKK